VVELENGYVPIGTVVQSARELERLLACWLAESRRSTVGDVGSFGGSPAITVRLAADEFVLNRDTKRAAVQTFLAAAREAGGADHLPWRVTTNARGAGTRVTYRPDDAPTPGWYAYVRGGGRTGKPPMARSAPVQVVQFVHPGFEYHRVEHVGSRRVRSGVMNWKRGNTGHDRKFIVSRGSLFEPDTGRDLRDASIVFWGEWEGPSVFWKIDGTPGKPKPSVLHAPFRPDRPPLDSASVQNTDPMVFGDAFIYSNCLQDAFVSLKRLAAGSIVLFGRHSRAAGKPAFSLDTCLVVDRVEALEPLPFDPVAYGEDILDDAVMSPLHSEGAVSAFAVYFAKMRTDDGSPFSFFPARLLDDKERLFARPQLTPKGALKDVISPENMQGIKGRSITAAERDAIWREVARQIVQHGCGLGYRAAAPPLLASQTAEAAALGSPGPLG
jgi:hypothetical protein